METFAPALVTAADVPSPPGLHDLPGYVTEADERALVEAIDRRPWNTEWRRRRQPYGAGYRSGGDSPPIPDWGRRLTARVFEDRVMGRPFDQMLVNEYMPGQGISSHRDDAPFGRTVVSLGLFSPVVMDFRHPPTGRRKSLLLEPRSLLVLSDESREQGIAPRKRDVWQGIRVGRDRRLSVTFRVRDLEARP